MHEGIAASPVAQQDRLVSLDIMRGVALFGFGIVHGYLLLWTGEILFFYGATAPFVFAFRRAAPRTLFAFALGGLLVGAAWNQLDAYGAIKKHTAYQEARAAQAAGATLTRPQTKALKAWPELVNEMNPNADKIRDTLESMRGSYTTVVAFQAPMVAHYESWFQYRNFFEVRHLLTYNFHALARQQAEVSYDLGRLAMTAGHVGLLMLFCNAGILGWLQRRLAAVGQMALTNYVTHSMVCMVVFRSFGFGLYGHLSRHQLYYVVFSIWVVQLVVSPIWLAHFRFGPLEWLWRTLTYGVRQPMRRVSRVGGGDPLVAPAG